MQINWTTRHALGLIATAPVLASIVGSIFNIWYNVTQVQPLLSAEQRDLFKDSIVYYNVLGYPVLIAIWIGSVFSIRKTLRAIIYGGEVDPESLAKSRVRTINLPWHVGALVAVGWIVCIPALLIGLQQSAEPIDQRVLFHLPTSIIIAALINVTLAFFIVELITGRILFPILFADASPSKTPGAVSLHLGRRNLLNAIAACVCPILSIILLAFVEADRIDNLNWFMVYVGLIGIAIGLFCSWMVSTHVIVPIRELTSAAHEVGQGNLDTRLKLQRADEFGPLIDEFNRMIEDMRAKRELRQRFGLHVGRRTAEIILAQDAGLSGNEQTVTVMFCDIRNFTARCAVTPANEIVPLLNRFLTMMVDVVENQHHGNVNKFLGDGFMALFGIGEQQANRNHVADAVNAGLEMIARLKEMNAELTDSDIPTLGIGVGIHTGTAIVGSMGSDDRLEYTAIGDTVNLASRVEGLTKSVGEPLLMTAAAAECIADSFDIQPLEPQSVKGQPVPVEICTVR
ncbi:MAG: HAMP domain-containing protein [Planctomycetaceae bacterium]|jgi:adenylate cyclase|nr:HAMP domain-containing protein [Planctomycetaceae bacterium]MBT6153310.1 HAMP domain-containing protein [Planctomycetaceae bacterium]MBT6483229.1 HAMP domain-containing protein [Planctomycetaceae bacterium]MBT6496334.1 HAMP domain-containing protein [Planctomycetaceae bacterium]